MGVPRRFLQRERDRERLRLQRQWEPALSGNQATRSNPHNPFVFFFCGKRVEPQAENVREPVVVVAEVEGQPVRVLIYSGSLGDLLSTTLADAKEDAGSYPARSCKVNTHATWSGNPTVHSVDVSNTYVNTCGNNPAQVQTCRSHLDVFTGRTPVSQFNLRVQLPAR